ncbi:hypothetical protein DWB61_16865 [Ancylomarina euxinus]|uniref:Uncharacterized protein n=1 Tax=Ancylomarina euxinus TaxID=2283627 RepID=A0A425XWP7_9BACT|nr:hypothetical protein DWB61_16865 [Ancylomarina euxinus]
MNIATCQICQVKPKVKESKSQKRLRQKKAQKRKKETCQCETKSFLTEFHKTQMDFITGISV